MRPSVFPTIALAFLLLGAGCGKKGGDDEGAAKDPVSEPTRDHTSRSSRSDAAPAPAPAETGGAFGTPQAAWSSFVAAVEAGDADAVWATLSDASIDEALNGSMAEFIQKVPMMPPDQLAALAAAAGTTADAIQSMDPTSLAKTVMLAEAAKNREFIVGAQWKSVTTTNAVAVATTSSPAGERKWAFVEQSNGWRMDGPRTAKLRGAPPPPVPPPAP